MVDLRIFANARFSAASFAVTMIFLALFGWLFLFTQQLQFVLGYSALQAGVRCLPVRAHHGRGLPGVGQAGRPHRHQGGRHRRSGASWRSAWRCSRPRPSHTGYPFLMVASMIVAAGMGLAMAPATESIMGSLPRAQAGVGSAVNDTTRFVGGALGVALTGSVASSVFASHLHPVLTHVPARYVGRGEGSVGARRHRRAARSGILRPRHGRHRPPGLRGRFRPGDARCRRGRRPRLAGGRPVPAGPGRSAAAEPAVEIAPVGFECSRPRHDDQCLGQRQLVTTDDQRHQRRTIMTISIIQEGTSTVTLVNVFTVDPRDQQRLVEHWQQATEEVIRHLPGFISANVHRSLDGTKVINYAQWESRDAFDAMRHNPKAAHTSESSVRSEPQHPSCARWCLFTTSESRMESDLNIWVAQASSRRPTSWAFLREPLVDRRRVGRAP